MKRKKSKSAKSINEIDGLMARNEVYLKSFDTPKSNNVTQSPNPQIPLVSTFSCKGVRRKPPMVDATTRKIHLLTIPLIELLRY